MENHKTRKILVVDDDQKFVFSVAKYLIGHGYHLLTAYDAVYGMKHACNEEIALIILDLGLPGGGGFAMLENLRKLPKTICIPIIISTANISGGVEEKVREMGANDFIVKPYDLEKLLAMIKTILPEK